MEVNYTSNQTTLKLNLVWQLQSTYIIKANLAPIGHPSYSPKLSPEKQAITAKGLVKLMTTLTLTINDLNKQIEQEKSKRSAQLSNTVAVNKNAFSIN